MFALNGVKVSKKFLLNDVFDVVLEQGHVVLQIFETSVTATVASAPFGLFDFKVVIVGRERDLKCDIKGGSDPLACTIKNLTPATTYNLKVFNCRQGSSFCSDTLYNGWFTTVADGKSLNKFRLPYVRNSAKVLLNMWVTKSVMRLNKMVDASQRHIGLQSSKTNLDWFVECSMKIEPWH